MNHTPLFFATAPKHMAGGVALVFEPHEGEQQDPGDFAELSFVLAFLDSMRFEQQIPTQDMPFIAIAGKGTSLGEVLEQTQGCNSLFLPVMIGFTDAHAEFFRKLVEEIEQYMKDPSSALERFSVTSRAKYFEQIRREYFPVLAEMN